jgi:Domain of unknown function (DUF4136)
MIPIGILLFSLALGQVNEVVGKVETTFDKKANFASLRTYSWAPGYNAQRADVHKMIVAACEAEMTKSGFTKVPTGGDVTLAYYTVSATYVDPKALDKLQREGSNATPPRDTVGRLAVIMRAGTSSTQQLWSASTRELIDPDQTKLEGTIRTATARLFDTYPGRKAKRQ